MKNTSSLFLTLVSYLIMLATLVFLLFAIVPSSLKAQTNADMVATNAAVTNIEVTNAAVTNVAGPAAVEAKQAPQASPVHIEHSGSPFGDLGFGKTLVAVVPVISPFILPIVIIFVVFYFKFQRTKLEHETVRMMIEKGVPVTPEVIAALRNKNGYEKYGIRAKDKTGLLLTGLILAGIGIGVIMVAGKPGFIVMFVGVAFLIVWLIEGRKQNDQQPPKP